MALIDSRRVMHGEWETQRRCWPMPDIVGDEAFLNAQAGWHVGLPRIQSGVTHLRRPLRTSPIDTNADLAAVATAVVIDPSVIPGTRIHEYVPRQLRTDARAQTHP